MNVVIYARYSSHNQTEQSIEGQLQVCYNYANAQGYTVVGEYIDRMRSGKFDDRVEFQKMISDSDKHTFQGVIVYQLDRFARNRFDSATYKAKLKKNGVRVLSAKENITDDASGILIEGVLESMAEYYSAELAQKIDRGMAINAEKCLSNGSKPGLGFKVDSQHRFYVDEDEAKTVREIFERYASGETVASITADLNKRRITTALGREFNKNSLHRMLRNRRYIGIYIFKGKETPGGMPRIIDDDLFYRVQNILSKNKSAPARSRGKEEYLLTTKLYCGCCGEMMTGYTGTSANGSKYHYYICNNAKKKKCSKKLIKKDHIEEKVVQACVDLLSEDNIEYIADRIYKVCKSSGENPAIKKLKSALKECETSIENLWRALESGQGVEKIMERISAREAEKAEIEQQLAIELNKDMTVEYPFILAFLERLCATANSDKFKRNSLINTFVDRVQLHDDYFTLVLYAGNKSGVKAADIKEIEATLQNKGDCSFLDSSAPPDKHKTNTCFFKCGFAVMVSL